MAPGIWIQVGGFEGPPIQDKLAEWACPEQGAAEKAPATAAGPPQAKAPGMAAWLYMATPSTAEFKASSGGTYFVKRHACALAHAALLTATASRRGGRSRAPPPSTAARRRRPARACWASSGA